MKILIVEDEQLAADRMIQLLCEAEPDALISGPFDTVVSTVKHLRANPGYDLIFLDIQLADGRSFAIFDHIKVDTPVIFTTAYDEFALKAFDLNSIDYLLKPINRDKLKTALDKFRKLKTLFGGDNPNNQLYDLIKNLRVQSQPAYKDRFLVSRSDSMIPVKAEDVACFYAEEKAVFILTKDSKRHLISQTLEDIEAKSDPNRFFRVNRQVIVSADAVKKIHNYFNFKLKVELLPDPGFEVIVSRSRTAAFKAWISGEMMK